VNAVRRALRLEGYDVELAADGEEALARLAAVNAELVVLDVLMSGVDGITVCRRLRERRGSHSDSDVDACDARHRHRNRRKE
jgi:CheY-like chemotaxis protein